MKRTPSIVDDQRAADGRGACHRDHHQSLRAGAIPGAAKRLSLERCTLRRSRPSAARSPFARLGNVRRRTPFSLRKRKFRVQEEVMKMKIGVFAVGTALVFGMATGAWAQSGGAGGAGGGAAGAGAGGNSMGSSVGGGRVTPSAPHLNSPSPNSVPQSNETPVSPGTGPGNGTH